MKNLILKILIIVAFIIALIEIIFINRAASIYKNNSELVVERKSIIKNNDKKINKTFKVYGYSDILDILKNYEKLNIIKFEKQQGNRATVKVTVEYFGGIEEAKECLNEICKADVFNKIDQFAVAYGEKNSISVDLEFKYGVYSIS